MTLWWHDLSDDELRARLQRITSRENEQNLAGVLVRIREVPDAAERITEILER